MRKLTFEGFLKQYVAELSGTQTASVHKLADCLRENPRLKEPLYLYALAFDKVNLLLRYTKGNDCFAEYEQLSNCYSLAQMLLLLEKQSPELPEGYRKVWRSYCSVRDAVLADNDTNKFPETSLHSLLPLMLPLMPRKLHHPDMELLPLPVTDHLIRYL